MHRLLLTSTRGAKKSPKCPCRNRRNNAPNDEKHDRYICPLGIFSVRFPGTRHAAAAAVEQSAPVPRNRLAGAKSRAAAAGRRVIAGAAGRWGR